jgi:hypothetical protein
MVPITNHDHQLAHPWVVDLILGGPSNWKHLERHDLEYDHS